MSETVKSLHHDLRFAALQRRFGETRPNALRSASAGVLATGSERL